jgi:hypothetical protein
MPRFDFFAQCVCIMYLDTTEWMPRTIRHKEGKSLRIRFYGMPCFFSAELFVLIVSDFIHILAFEMCQPAGVLNL